MQIDLFGFMISLIPNNRALEVLFCRMEIRLQKRPVYLLRQP